jgi:hypothetical protein
LPPFAGVINDVVSIRPHVQAFRAEVLYRFRRDIAAACHQELNGSPKPNRWTVEAVPPNSAAGADAERTFPV